LRQKAKKVERFALPSLTSRRPIRVFGREKAD